MAACLPRTRFIRRIQRIFAAVPMVIAPASFLSTRLRSEQRVFLGVVVRGDGGLPPAHAVHQADPENLRRRTDGHRAGQLLIDAIAERSEEHTSELQSRLHLVCRLLLE